MEKKSSNSIDWRYLFRESVLILGLSYFFLLASTHNGLASFPIFALTIALFSLFEIIWLFKGQQVAIKKELPVIAFLVVLALAAFFSVDPRRSFTEVWLIAAACFLFLLTSELVNRGWDVDLWVKASLVAGAIVMIFTWREALVWYQQWFNSTGKIIPDISYRLPAPNFLAVFLNILLMVAAANLLFTRSKAGKLLLILWILSALGLIYLTSSRGGWLGTVAGLGSLFLLSALVFPDKRKAIMKWLRKRRFILILFFVGFVTVVVVFAWVFIQQSQLPTHATIGESRSFLWNPAFTAFLRSPIIGSGPYTYISFYVQQQSMPPSPIYLYAHSIYLDLLSGSGVVGLGAFLGLVVCLIIALFKKTKSKSGLARSAAMASMGALAAFLVHGVVDSVHHTIPTVAWLLAIVLGVGLGGFEDQKPRRISISWLLGMVLVAAGIFNLWAEKPLVDAVIAGNSGLWQQARENFQQAIERDPDLAVVPQQAGLVESQLAYHGEIEALQSAIAYFESAIEMDPWWGLNYANLGVLYRVDGELDLSAERLEKAVALSPKSALFHLNLGITYEAMGKDELAAQAYRTAIELQPDWDKANFWRETPFRESLNLSTNETGSTGLKMEQAQEELARNPHRLLSYLDVIPFYLDDGRIEDAENAIRFGKLAYSDKAGEQMLLRWYEARLSAAKRDYEDAAKIGEDTVLKYLQQGVYGPGTFGKMKYVQLAFRRPAMMMEVVPQMEMIFLPDEWGDRLAQTAEWYRQAGHPQQADKLIREISKYIPDWENASNEVNSADQPQN